jgi:hypothetical protein
MRSFAHFMPGEIQGCVGCHEPRNHSPRPQARLAAIRRNSAQPKPPTPPEWGLGGFSYARIVQPVLDKHCIRCHSGPTSPKEVDLSGDETDFFNVSYETLARQGQPGKNLYTKWIPTFNGQEANILIVTPKSWGSPVSKLAEVVLAGHPDKNGKPRIKLGDKERRRIFTWIDLNVPYYGTSLSNYYERTGCRRMIPSNFEDLFQKVARKRCASCHKPDSKGVVQVPRKVWLRITNPDLNNFLLAPLAKDAGGTQRCGTAVFESTHDTDYRAILNTFEPLHKMLEEQPRMDMTGAKEQTLRLVKNH